MRLHAKPWIYAGLGALLVVSGCSRESGGAAAPAPGTASAASATQIQAALDPCASGQQGFAQQICQNHALASLDQQVSGQLTAEAASVSQEGAQRLVQDQQRWRESQRIACGVVDPDATPTPEQQTCLEAAYRTRAQDAQSAVQQMGGYTFQRVENIQAQAVTAEAAAATGLGEEAPPAVTRDIRYPRIDGPQTPQIQRFNQLVAQQPQYKLEDAVEEQVGYRIAYAGPELISVRFDLYQNSLGAAHPDSSTKAVTVNMITGQPLSVGDVFRPGSNWQDFLARRAMRDLTAQFREYQFVPTESDVRDSVQKPQLWLITDRALVVLFPPYSFGGPHAIGGAEVTIPWSDLRTYLNPNAPQPIRQPS
jgi:uncharacterized protein